MQLKIDIKGSLDGNSYDKTLNWSLSKVGGNFAPKEVDNRSDEILVFGLKYLEIVLAVLIIFLGSMVYLIAKYRNLINRSVEKFIKWYNLQSKLVRYIVITVTVLAIFAIYQLPFVGAIVGILMILFLVYIVIYWDRYKHNFSDLSSNKDKFNE